MPHYQPPLRDYQFILHEALKIHEETAIEGYEDLSEDFTGPVLEEAGKIARDLLAPLNRVGDEEGCRLENALERSTWEKHTSDLTNTRILPGKFSTPTTTGPTMRNSKPSPPHSGGSGLQSST